jgi:hypothetical protein
MARRVVLLVLAGALCAAVTLLGRETELAVPGARDWTARHPDPRALDAESGRALAAQLDGERRNDVALLLAALAAGCVVVAAWPRVARWTGGASTAVLLCGSVGLGLFHLGVSAAGQVEGLRDGTWSVADGTLDRVAPVQAGTLRDWRERIGPDDAVILIGSDPWLYDLVVWALHPRALYPMLLEIRPTTSVDEVLRGARSLSVGRGHSARWVIDLDVLRQGRETGHPALIQVE